MKKFLAAIVATFAVAVSPMPAQAAAPTDWQPRDTDVATSWDPCKAITWSVNTDGIPLMEKAAVKAMKRVAKFTSFTFTRVEGEADLEIGWRDSSDPAMANNGGYSGIEWWYDTNGVRWYANATAYINSMYKPTLTSQPMRKWFRAAVQHEVGHALGLGHVSTPTELMYAGVLLDTNMTKFGVGDRTGLASLAQGRDCAAAPSVARTGMTRSVIID